MLEIYINGQKADLPADIAISLTIENPFIVEDRIPVAHSVSFELPPTKTNNRIFDYASRIAGIMAGSGFLKNYSCQILFDAITISTGYVELTEVSGSYKCFFKAVEITGSLRGELPATELHRYEFPTSSMFVVNFDDPSNFAYDYRQLALNAAAGSNPMMVSAPIRVGGSEPLNFIHGLISVPVMGEVIETPIAKNSAAMMEVEYINFYNPKTNEFMLRGVFDPLAGPDAYHAGMFPMVRLHYLLDQMFGARLDNNFFASGELANLVVPSTFLSTWFAPGTWIYIAPLKGMLFENAYPSTDDPYFTLNGFQSAMLASEFIRQILKLFCATLVPVRGRWVLKQNKDIVNDSAAADWSEKLIGLPTISIENGRRYKYGYDGSAPKSYPLVTEIASVNAMILDNIDPVGDGSAEKTYKILTTGQIFKKTTEKIMPLDEEGDPIIRNQYELLDDGFGQSSDEETGQRVFDVSSEIQPMDVGPAEYWWDAENSVDEHPETSWWGVPVWDGDRMARPEQSAIMFFRGMTTAPSGGDTYPLITPYNYAPNGSRVGNYSLVWDGEDGLINKFHKEFKSWTEKDKAVASSAVHMKAVDLHNLDITKKVLLNGRKFYLKSLRVTLKSNRIEPAICDFVEA